MNYISFPGLGIGSFGLNPVAFSLFGIDIMWYGIIITVGMVLAYFYGLSRAKIEGIKADDITDLTLFLIIFGVIGARLYYVIFNIGDYIVTNQPSAWSNFSSTIVKIVSVREGGLAIYGGIIAGFITAFVVARIKKIHFSILLDLLAPCVIIGQTIGRWGNFVNVEAYGSETTLPWRMGVGIAGTAPYVHPTFLYESLWNLVGFIIIACLYKKKKFHGEVFLVYLTWYGIGRCMIEGLRTDSLYLGPIRVSQLFAGITAIAGIALLVLGFMRAPKIIREAADKSDAEKEPASVIKADTADISSEAGDAVNSANAENEKSELKEQNGDTNGKDN